MCSCTLWASCAETFSLASFMPLVMPAARSCAPVFMSSIALLILTIIKLTFLLRMAVWLLTFLTTGSAAASLKSFAPCSAPLAAEWMSSMTALALDIMLPTLCSTLAFRLLMPLFTPVATLFIRRLTFSFSSATFCAGLLFAFATGCSAPYAAETPRTRRPPWVDVDVRAWTHRSKPRQRLRHMLPEGVKCSDKIPKVPAKGPMVPRVDTP
mmetsp:Transcript_79771/g.247420  ORF Transcript_79771/g.247420 Transcript_79771/m.247420 type:complete len:211 (-) Transcript_79771:51-683(-)